MSRRKEWREWKVVAYAVPGAFPELSGTLPGIPTPRTPQNSQNSEGHRTMLKNNNLKMLRNLLMVVFVFGFLLNATYNFNRIDTGETWTGQSDNSGIFSPSICYLKTVDKNGYDENLAKWCTIEYEYGVFKITEKEGTYQTWAVTPLGSSKLYKIGSPHKEYETERTSGKIIIHANYNKNLYGRVGEIERTSFGKTYHVLYFVLGPHLYAIDFILVIIFIIVLLMTTRLSVDA